ncbi:phage tail protein [Pseudomonas protegens]|uniref:phage tail protein n=1 Tax=Pseudomonas protegens TaxID=380021 RepID=UPI00098D3793|nr:tail fiber protein [Pseudomonas protegens]GED73154.1 microcystin dependent MdpB family protein [Pseudomonas fluorescens]AQT10485.1 tail collar domain-containing protein [Pseudomonas protegens]MBP5104147.1 phage tail protein [Pseudomonas protegens]MBP5132879.1 phage tail protein [Pseudomonas protegens]MBP5148990.1 phage tail protein [Pseudomonas protegens]
MDPFVGEIRLFPWGWAPQGWLVCEGQILPFQQYVALASLLGTRFGGNGSTTFGLPDLRGRAAMGVNMVASTVDPIIGVHALASTNGTETVTLGADSLPAHTHTAYASDAPGTMGPAGGIPAVSSNSSGAVFKPTYVTANTTTPPTALVSLNSTSVVPTQGVPLGNMQPSIVGYFCIATTGIYPPRP